MSTPARVTVFDTTLRDGEQAPGFSMDVPAKLAMAHALEAAERKRIHTFIATSDLHLTAKLRISRE